MDYGGSLENCWRRKSPVGSNPTPSAKYLWFMILLYTLHGVWHSQNKLTKTTDFMYKSSSSVRGSFVLKIIS